MVLGHMVTNMMTSQTYCQHFIYIVLHAVSYYYYYYYSVRSLLHSLAVDLF